MCVSESERESERERGFMALLWCPPSCEIAVLVGVLKKRLRLVREGDKRENGVSFEKEPT